MSESLSHSSADDENHRRWLARNRDAFKAACRAEGIDLDDPDTLRTIFANMGNGNIDDSQLEDEEPFSLN